MAYARDKVVIFRGKGKHPFFWKIVGPNGRTLAVSEGYAKRGNLCHSVMKFLRRVESNLCRGASNGTRWPYAFEIVDETVKK